MIVDPNLVPPDRTGQPPGQRSPARDATMTYVKLAADRTRAGEPLDPVADPQPRGWRAWVRRLLRRGT